LSAAELQGASEAERTRYELLRKPPIVLEANESVVLKALEEQMALRDAALTPAAPGIHA
jgi:hypothetical protein